ncbi:MAG: hypothetical protein FGM22_10835 [Burkholderiaceae bacterium]|nr:hypothetical protein [Burkholderiaceae bacterium]
MATTTQDGFHPMRGHVEKGTTIRMRNGAVLTLLPAGVRGWKLQRQDGTVYADDLPSAFAVTDAVILYEE